MASPVKGYPISTEFGVKGSRWSSKRHEGVDFAAPVGTNVLAPSLVKLLQLVESGASHSGIIPCCLKLQKVTCCLLIVQNT